MFNDSVGGREFFGRVDELSLLEKRVAALKEGYRQNIAITGQRLSGKTCLLYHFLDGLKDPSVLPIYVEVINEPFPIFAERFMGTLLYAFLRWRGELPREDFAFLLESAKPYIPQTVAAILEVKHELEKKDFNKAYLDLLNITSIVKKETGIKCIVILDEFQNLSFFSMREPFAHFGKVMMIQKDTMYVISSSDNVAIQRILAEKLSLLFGNFEVIELKGFNFNSSKEFLKGKLAQFKMSDGLLRFLITFTDGNPFYLDLLCAKVRDLAFAAATDVINTKIVVDALEYLYFNSKGTVNQYFTNLINSLYLNATTLDVLVAIAKGAHTVNKIREMIGMSMGEISFRLKRLLELNVIFKSGTFYFVVDKGFSFWVKEVYNRKQTSLVSSATMRSDRFKHDVHAHLSKFLFTLRKSGYQRVAELFAAFRGEIAGIDGKKHRLPHFGKIDLISLNKTSSLLLGHKDKRLWSCFIKEGVIDEDDIALFIKETNKMSLKVIKKVLVPLDGIDLNATLLAKVNKIWIWNLKSLNFIMDIYNKDKVIRFG
jgi:AAA+ ATPase superfamily predicted ATPase